MRYNQLSTGIFIAKAKKLYGDKYDYSLVEYIRSNIKVKIVCPKHGIYETAPNNHLRKMGNCPKCAKISRAEKRRSNTQEFIARALKVHGDKYDYSQTEYSDINSKVKIVCPKHGEFMQTPSVHLVGKGCRECSDVKHRSSTQEFLEKAKKVHGDLFDYSLVEYKTSRKRVKIICHKHGVFEQMPSHHLKGSGCPICLESKGERKIADFLDAHQIEFRREKNFEGCRMIKPLFFDFYVLKLNTCIEYDGMQHYVSCDYFGGQPVFEQTQKSDAIKTSYCLNNNIKLVRIPYTKDSQIIPILEKELLKMVPSC